jgi:hypothetical protein
MGSEVESLAGSKAVVHVAVRPRTQPRSNPWKGLLLGDNAALALLFANDVHFEF